MRFNGQSSRFKIAGIFSLCCTAALLLFCSSASAELTIKTGNDLIKIDFFYSGEKLKISGISDPGVDLIVKIASPDKDQTLRKKGKLAGVLWLNVGDIIFRQAPILYFVHGTQKADEILTRDEMDKYLIGYQSLKNHIEMSPAPEEDKKAAWLGEFIKFKESSRLYSSSYGKIMTSEKGGIQAYHISLDWPYQAPPGRYAAAVFAVKDNKIVGKAESFLVVEQTGFIRTLADMAKNNGALYGILSIAVALGAGFGVGMIFRKGGSSH